jgi:hypothetical protein
MTDIVMLDLLGGVALLLWGLHMVHSGFVRAFGSDLRRILGTALRNRTATFGGSTSLGRSRQPHRPIGISKHDAARRLILDNAWRLAGGRDACICAIRSGAGDVTGCHQSVWGGC